MDDVSTDDELANLPTILPDMTPRMGKSVSLPVMDESQESRLERTSQWAQSQFSFGHPFSDTDMSPVARLERVCPHDHESCLVKHLKFCLFISLMNCEYTCTKAPYLFKLTWVSFTKRLTTCN